MLAADFKRNGFIRLGLDIYAKFGNIEITFYRIIPYSVSTAVSIYIPIKIA